MSRIGRPPERFVWLDGKRVTLRELAARAGLSRQRVTSLLDRGHSAAAIVAGEHRAAPPYDPDARCSSCEHVGHRARSCPMVVGDVGEHGLGRAWGPMVVDTLRLTRLLLEAGRAGMSVEQMIDATDTSRSTVYRLLATIREAGWSLRVMHDRHDSRRAYYWIEATRSRRRR